MSEKSSPDSPALHDVGHVQLTAGERRSTLRRFRLISLCVLSLLVFGAAAAFVMRHSQAKVASTDSELQNRIFVNTVRAKPDDKGQPLSLPGTLQGFIESPISARINGYLVRWHKDIGSQVAKGDVLAEISNPEVDQQLAQAIAERKRISLTLSLAKTSMERWQKLRNDNAVSVQEFDEGLSAYQQTLADVDAADATIRRLKEMQSLKRVVAPFSGIVTRRNVNIGDLIETGGGEGRVLFTLAQIDPLRVYVYVPQSYTAQVKVGMPVTVTQAEMPDQVFLGKIVRTAGAIDAASRSMQIEISLSNSNGVLLPGAFVNASMPVEATAPLVVPTNTLLIRSEGPRIGVVNEKGQVQLRPVVIGKDFGLNVQIISGITADDTLVLNPPDFLADGDQVTVIAPKKSKSDT